MADKITQLLTDALSRAAADPAGVPLYSTKSDAGLFPGTAIAKPVAQKALADGLLKAVRVETKGKSTRELCAATEKGLRFLLEQVSPKQVLEDFVRVLEERGEQVAELRDAASRMADTLAGLKAAVAVVLPQVQASRIPFPPSPLAGEGPGVRGEPCLSPLSPRGREAGGEGQTSPQAGGRFPPETALPLTPNPSTQRGEGNKTNALGTIAMNGAATLEAPVMTDTDDLTGAILTRLADWASSAAVGQDCPLPELYRSLTTREVPPTIGAFHDCLRQLHDHHRIYLHPWTGPLYALPEPAYALLVGHNIAYYASARS